LESFVFFVSTLISGVGLGYFVLGHWALGANTKAQFFDSSC